MNLHWVYHRCCPPVQTLHCQLKSCTICESSFSLPSLLSSSPDPPLSVEVLYHLWIFICESSFSLPSLLNCPPVQTLHCQLKSWTICESSFSLPSLLSSSPDSPLSVEVLYHLWIFIQFPISVVLQSRLSTVSWSPVPFVNLHWVYHLCCPPVQTLHCQLKSCTICESSLSLPSLLSSSPDSPLSVKVLYHLWNFIQFPISVVLQSRLSTVSWSPEPFVNLYSVYHLCCPPVQTLHCQLKSCTICESSFSFPFLLSSSPDPPLSVKVLYHLWNFIQFTISVVLQSKPSTVSWSPVPFVNLHWVYHLCCPPVQTLHCQLKSCTICESSFSLPSLLSSSPDPPLSVEVLYHLWIFICESSFSLPSLLNCPPVQTLHCQLKSWTICESSFSLPSLLSSSPDSPLSVEVLYHLWIFIQFPISVVLQSRLSTVSWSPVPFVNLHWVYHLCCPPVQTLHCQLKSCTICESSLSLPSLLSSSPDSPLSVKVLYHFWNFIQFPISVVLQSRLSTVSWSPEPFVNLYSVYHLCCPPVQTLHCQLKSCTICESSFSFPFLLSSSPDPPLSVKVLYHLWNFIQFTISVVLQSKPSTVSWSPVPFVNLHWVYHLCCPPVQTLHCQLKSCTICESSFSFPFLLSSSPDSPLSVEVLNHLWIFIQFIISAVLQSRLSTVS